MAQLKQKRGGVVAWCLVTQQRPKYDEEAAGIKLDSSLEAYSSSQPPVISQNQPDTSSGFRNPLFCIPLQGENRV